MSSEFVLVTMIAGAAVWMSPSSSHARLAASRRSSTWVSPARASSAAYTRASAAVSSAVSTWCVESLLLLFIGAAREVVTGAVRDVLLSIGPERGAGRRAVVLRKDRRELVLVAGHARTTRTDILLQVRGRPSRRPPQRLLRRRRALRRALRRRRGRGGPSVPSRRPRARRG